ncbi:MAG: carbohydrate kinase, partial [Clostridia bacterium]|nr:carbohydrate kinase [Clostridia bacterium]
MMYLGGLDVGTTGCKLTVYNEKGEFLFKAYEEYEASRTEGEHEIDVAEIFRGVKSVIRQGAKDYPIDAMGVTTFGETFVMLDAEDKVLLPAMLYTDPRGEAQCRALCDSFGEEALIDICGVKPHAMYSLPKVMWIKENRPEIYGKAKRVLLMADYIVYMLSGQAKIDYSLAARTMALDIRKKEWSKEIFGAAGVPCELFSQVVPTGSIAGNIRPEL